MGVDEVGVFGDDDPAVARGAGVDFGVGSLVAARQIERVQRIVPHPL